MIEMNFYLYINHVFCIGLGGIEKIGIAFMCFDNVNLTRYLFFSDLLLNSTVPYSVRASKFLHVNRIWITNKMNMQDLVT